MDILKAHKEKQQLVIFMVRLMKLGKGRKEVLLSQIHSYILYQLFIAA